MSMDDLVRLVRNPPIEYRPEVRWWLAEGLHTDETLRYEIDAAHQARVRWHGVPGHGRRRYRPHSLRLGSGGVGPRLADRRRGDDEAEHVGVSISPPGHKLVQRQPTDHRPRPPSGGQGTRRCHRGSVRRDVTQRRAAAHRLGGNTCSQAPSRAARSHPHPDACRRRSGPRVGGGGGRGDPRRRLRGGADRSGAGRGAEAGGRHQAWAPGGSVRVLDAPGPVRPPPRPPRSTTPYSPYVDPDGAQAVIDYWDSVVLTPALREQIARNPRVQMYMRIPEASTFGAGGLFWGHTVVEEFAARRGYGITPWLPFLTRNVSFMAVDTVYHNEPSEGHRFTVEKVRFDYVRTLTDLYIENMLRPFATFLHANGMTLVPRSATGCRSRLTPAWPGGRRDQKTESLEFAAQHRRLPAACWSCPPVRQAVLLGDRSHHPQPRPRPSLLRPDHRHPARRGHHQDRPARLGQHRRRRGRHRVAGSPGHVADVLRTVRHSAAWPGVLPALERGHGSVPGSLLRQGNPRIDVGILRTNHFTDNIVRHRVHRRGWSAASTTRRPTGRLWMRNRENHWWQDLGMQDAGWTYEFFDGSLLRHEEVFFSDGLVQPDGPGYQAMIIDAVAMEEAYDPRPAAERHPRTERRLHQHVRQVPGRPPVGGAPASIRSLAWPTRPVDGHGRTTPASWSTSSRSDQH